jgi:hypothetical protein
VDDDGGVWLPRARAPVQFPVSPVDAGHGHTKVLWREMGDLMGPRSGGKREKLDSVGGDEEVAAEQRGPRDRLEEKGGDEGQPLLARQHANLCQGFVSRRCCHWCRREWVGGGVVDGGEVRYGGGGPANVLDACFPACWCAGRRHRRRSQ